MAKKDFSTIPTTRIYETMAEATAEPEAPAAAPDETAAGGTSQAAQAAAGADPEDLTGLISEHTAEMVGRSGRKPRKTYTDAEAIELMNSLRTTGHKGLKMPRINLAFAPDVYAYIKTMSQVRGENLTEFVNAVLRKHMEENEDIYARAIDFKNSL